METIPLASVRFCCCCRFFQGQQLFVVFGGGGERCLWFGCGLFGGVGGCGVFFSLYFPCLALCMCTPLLSLVVGMICYRIQVEEEEETCKTFPVDKKLFVRVTWTFSTLWHWTTIVAPSYYHNRKQHFADCLISFLTLVFPDSKSSFEALCLPSLCEEISQIILQKGIQS